MGSKDVIGESVKGYSKMTCYEVAAKSCRKRRFWLF